MENVKLVDDLKCCQSSGVKGQFDHIPFLLPNRNEIGQVHDQFDLCGYGCIWLFDNQLSRLVGYDIPITE